jgi:hypothetical protein
MMMMMTLIGNKTIKTIVRDTLSMSIYTSM